MNRFAARFLLIATLSGVLGVASEPVQLPTGLAITPDALPHSVQMPLNPGMPGRPDVTLGQAVTTAVSPDGSRLLVLTSGYNIEGGGARFNEYVFVYDITSFPPRQLQALPVPNSFCGLAWNPAGQEFYVSGGVDDKVYVFARRGVSFSRAAAISLGHPTGNGLLSNAPPPLNKDAPKPMVAGIAVNQSGATAVIANFYNDSISLIDLKTRRKSGELDLRPGVADRAKTGVAGGEFPYWVAIRGDNEAWISSPRDRELVVVQLGSAPTVTARIRMAGQPTRILLNRAQDKLFVAADNSDTVAVIDIGSRRILAEFGIAAPPGMLPAKAPKGANPNALALSPDERTLYVSDGGTNAIAVVALEPNGSGQVKGLIPTGWYPNSLSLSADGNTMYVVNGKSVPGPSRGNCRGDVGAPNIPDCPKTPNTYVYAREKSTLLSAPVPAAAELAALTQRAAENNRFDLVRSGNADPIMAELRRRVRHVIYIVKENRTYDQVLGDLEVGDGDPSLAEFPEPLTPNHHALARRFVTLDNFFDSGEVSGVGWNWSVAARTTDYTEKTMAPNYAGRGFTYDWEGTNRNVNVSVASLEERIKAQPLLAPDPQHPADPNLLPGAVDVAAPDAANGEAGAGYIWDEALRAGVTLRNYGFYCDLARYDNPRSNPAYLRISKTPFADHLPQAVPSARALWDKTDLYFRGFDQSNADFYLFREWEREFDQFVTGRNLPNLTLLRLSHDHFGDFGTALYGLNTPAMQMADNDYAIGLVAEKVANSPYRDDTLIFVIEDDAQDGPDHVDAHRSIAYVIGPYVKQAAVVSERYTTVGMIRTMEAILGVQPSSLFSAAATPMTDVFDMNQATWSFRAVVPGLLRQSELPLPPPTAADSLPPAGRALAYARKNHDGAYWQKKLGDMDYDEEDKLDTPRFNRELWKGMMGRQPYPTERSGKDLRQNRDALLTSYGLR
jgi:DNA-binding beta-propeller fold protein YncE